MDSNDLQQQLFTHLKDKLPPHLSMVNELEELLGLSADSVYRRIRGEKPISFNELKRICEHYHLSIDALLQLENESVLFRAPGVNGHGGDFAAYVKGMLGQFRFFNSFSEKKMLYLCKDIPFWYFYLYPEMGAFKSFFWIKTIHNDPSLANKQFSFSEYPYHDFFKIGQEIIVEYNKLESVELWNLESINSTINQISYYREAGLFASKEDEELVIDSFRKIIDHIQLQTEAGYKFLPGENELNHKGTIHFFVNELILGNNTILLELDKQRLSLITYSVLNYLMTYDQRFAEKAFNSFNALLSRSALISNTGEKERNRFFKSFREKINVLSK